MSKKPDVNVDKPDIVLREIDVEDRPLIKRIILGDKAALEKIVFTEVDIKTAILQGAMVISVPRELVENLKKCDANIERQNKQTDLSIMLESRLESLNE